MRLSFEYDKKPECCADCPCCDSDYIVCKITRKGVDDYFFENVPADCPLRIEAPVRHGKWIHMEMGGFKCNLCKSAAPFDEDYVEWLSGYCPNCGAKMDLEE